VALIIPRDHGERAAIEPVELEMQRSLETHGLALERGAHALLQLRVVGLPQAVARVDAPGIDLTGTEGNLRDVAARMQGNDAAALLMIVAGPGVDDDAVARLQRRVEADEQGVALESGDGAEEDAAFLGKAGVDELLVVDAPEPARVQAAGEGHLEFVTLVGTVRLGVCVVRATGGQAIECLAIHTGDAGNVFGRFEAPFDLERGHAGTNEVR
jgi:hypothetical protein